MILLKNQNADRKLYNIFHERRHCNTYQCSEKVKFQAITNPSGTKLLRKRKGKAKPFGRNSMITLSLRFFGKLVLKPFIIFKID